MYRTLLVAIVLLRLLGIAAKLLRVLLRLRLLQTPLISAWTGLPDILDLPGNCMIGRVASVVRRIAGEGLVEGSYSYAGAAAAAVVYSSDELAMPCGELGFKKLDARILAARILLLLRRRTSVSSVTV
jgi:hypothetical protein